MTLVGVVATAALAAFSNLFGASGSNEAPSADIVFSERFHAVGGAPGTAQIPAGTSIRLFAGNSSDPDSDLSNLTHKWITMPGEVRKICNAGESACRYHDFTTDTPGDYVVSLVVSDAQDFNHNCPLIHRWNNRLGCRKDAIATIQIEVLPASDPEIILTGAVESVTRGEAVTIDGGLSITFDAEMPSLSWRMDGQLIARNRRELTVATESIPEEKTEFALTVEARDRLGGLSTQTLDVAILPADLVPLPPIAVSGATQGGTVVGPANPDTQGGTASAILICRGGAEVSLAGPINAVQTNRPCLLPTRVITNGHAVSVIAERVVSSNTLIQGYTSPETPGTAGNPGANGRPGNGFGQDGEPGQNGFAGTNGTDGDPAAQILIRAETLEGSLRIDNSGQAGGHGGAGGAGGNGGAGAPGSPSQSGFLNCSSGPGRGGNGGAGGAGGSGGRGGAGGAAGPVVLEIEDTDQNATIEVSTLSGAPGRPGAGGAPGRGGRAGAEGPTIGFCGSAGRNGRPGATGQPGVSGDAPARLGPAPVTVNGEPQDGALQAKGALIFVGGDL